MKGLDLSRAYYNEVVKPLINDNMPQISSSHAAALIGMACCELRTSNESVDVGWFKREDVLDMIAHPILKDRMKDMLEFDGTVTYRAYSKKPYEIYVECTI